MHNAEFIFQIGQSYLISVYILSEREGNEHERKS